MWTLKVENWQIQKVFVYCFLNRIVSECTVIFCNISSQFRIESVLTSKFIGALYLFLKIRSILLKLSLFCSVIWRFQWGNDCILLKKHTQTWSSAMLIKMFISNMESLWNQISKFITIDVTKNIWGLIY